VTLRGELDEAVETAAHLEAELLAAQVSCTEIALSTSPPLVWLALGLVATAGE